LPTVNSEEKIENLLTGEVNIAISPYLFKRIIFAMQDQLKKFEEKNGEIKVDNKVTVFAPK
jgi:hypothetical protein